MGIIECAYRRVMNCGNELFENITIHQPLDILVLTRPIDDPALAMLAENG